MRSYMCAMEVSLISDPRRLTQLRLRSVKIQPKWHLKIIIGRIFIQNIVRGCLLSCLLNGLLFRAGICQPYFNTSFAVNPARVAEWRVASSGGIFVVT